MSSDKRLTWQTFVVRLWREAANGHWRGQIVHLTSRESAYFATLSQAEAFMSRFAEGIAGQVPTEEENYVDPKESKPDADAHAQV